MENCSPSPGADLHCRGDVHSLRKAVSMDHREVGRHWEGNAEAWTTLARQGYDVSRDWVNTPAFVNMLPEVSGLAGLDIGCGEGSKTRQLARRGARMTALDISPTFLRYAEQTEREEPLGIRYLLGSAVELPFEDARFDFATSFMCFMDVGETERVLAEAYRVIRVAAFSSSPSHTRASTPRTGAICEVKTGGRMQSRLASTSAIRAAKCWSGPSAQRHRKRGRACLPSGPPSSTGPSATG